ncbi:MAG: AAA family ATPase [Abitibacteriaceae bacterium]|nr:AAA family ATPase [Abditibacteriaceae bacterium]
MATTGVIVGKFYPPHRGHKHLIDTAASQVEELTVIVCDHPSQTIPGELRRQWLREIHPNARVLVIDDRYDENDSAVWAKNTIGWLGYVPDVVFTSEDYGTPFAACMGCRHVQVDKARVTVPCSGTMIRQRPLANWQFLEPPVRAYFAKRVCVVGAESTGTTTMAQALAKHYDTIWVPEYGREYWEEKIRHYDMNKVPWQSEEFTYIAEEQCRREDEAARQANRVLICDTNAWATRLWHERYLHYRSPEVEAVAAQQHYDLYLLTDVDIPFVQDGTRDGEHIRLAMHHQFEKELQEQSTPYALLSGPHEQRLQVAIKLIDALLEEA